ncbi:MAG: ABC transporter ATP-binding protein [Chloroflexi bacterium]|nr:ABC transporter ATP-binding protein [Chloroflexota bacterium]
MNDLVIETRGLTKWYGRVLAVDGLSLQVPRGGVFGLLGPNGSGKTTTMAMLLGLVRPTSGTMSLLGQDTDGGHDQALRRVGAIVEAPAFYPYLSGRANLLYFQGINGQGKPQEVDRLLEMVGLAVRANSKFATYSLGMKQRLGIAYALLGDPELLFLDEPTNGLDPAGMAEIRELIRGLGGGGRTVLLSSHLLHEVEQVCDQVAILSKGRLIAQGHVQELLRESRHVGVRLKTTDDVGTAAALASLSWVKNVKTENGYLLAGAPPERSWEITAALAQRGIFVAEMAPVQATLESYFLAVTGDDAPASGKEATP